MEPPTRPEPAVVRFRRLPIESAQPILLFAIARLGDRCRVAVGARRPRLPLQGKGAAVVGGLAVPWAALCLVLARREPERAPEPARRGRRPARPARDRAGRAGDLRRGTRHRPVPDRRTRPLPGRAARGAWSALLGSTALVPPPLCAATSRSTRDCSLLRDRLRAVGASRPGSWSAACAPRSRPAACGRAACRGARSRPRPRCAGAWPRRSTTARSRS